MADIPVDSIAKHSLYKSADYLDFDSHISIDKPGNEAIVMNKNHQHRYNCRVIWVEPNAAV
jgi:hypothetical protein